MPNTNPTIVSASLSDKELQDSINKMVANFDKGLQTMLEHSNEYVEKIQASLQKIGNTNFGAKGSNDGAVVKQTKAQNDFTDAVKKSTNEIKKQGKEGAMSFDQIAAAQQKAVSGGRMGVMETYNMQIEMFKNSLREVRQDIDIFNAAIGSGKKTQIEWGQQGLKQANAEAEKLMRIITTLENQRGNLANVLAPQGHTIQNYVNSLQKANPELAQLNEQFKRGKALLQQQKTEFEQNAQAQRGSANATNQQKQALDEMNAYIQQNIRREQERRDAIRQTGLAARETADQLIRSAHEQASAQGNSPITGIKELTVAVEQMRRAYFDMSASEKASPIGLALEADIKRANDAIAVIKKYNQSLLGSQQNDANKITNASTLNSLRESLKNLTEQYNKLTIAEIRAGKGDELIQKYQKISRAAHVLQKQLSTPISFSAIDKFNARSLDDIAYKMQMLRSYRQSIDLTKPNAANEIKQVDEALARLQKDADKWMSKSQEMIKSNTTLGRSWNYMKNRLAFYFTVGAGTSFIKNLIEVRSQYEMNERALGILINSAERGTQIFNELSQMALVSPYTLIELSTAAKQLTAYDVAAKDVVDTTRRLADMAAAVGIPIERLTYALGQIKAYGYLNSRDARMFANAGIPLVKQLSDYYTELEGRLVSTADVYDRIKKKAIDYNEVMEVINKMTDEGGKFFDFQAKMADTLKVRLANLTLAWNNMLNDMGKETQGVLTWGIGALREMFLHWKQLDSLIKNAAWALGIRTALMFIAYSALKAGAALGVTTKQMALSAVFGERLANVLKTVAATMKTVAMSKWTWISLFAIAAVEATQAIFGVNEAQKALNESIRNGAKDNYDNISKFLEQYKEVRDSLYKTVTKPVPNGMLNVQEWTDSQGNKWHNVSREYAETLPQDIDKNEAQKAWEAVREQIELTVASSDKYIGNLLSISNMSERVRQGFNLLDDVQVVNAALKELDDDTIKVSKDISAWWNAWQAPDGLIGNLKDLVDAENELIETYGSVEAAKKRGGKLYTDYEKRELAIFRNDLKETTDSIINFIELKGWSGNEGKINQVFEQITQKLVLDNQLDPQKAFTLQTEVEEARSKAAKEALSQRINDEKAAYKISHDESVRQALNADIERYNNWNETNGRSKVEWERFTKWLKEQHISETTAMFRNMDAEDIRSLNFQEGKHAEWVTRMVTQYAKEHKMSYDEAFKYLKSWVRSANQWSIYIPLTISTEDKKSVYDQLGEYDKAVDEADAQIERLTKRINELNAKKKKSKEETQELANAEQELADAQKAKADAEAKGGHGKKEKKDERAANKAAKQAESELAKALKDELSTIEKVRSIYKDLTKEGMSHADAVERATRGWGETVNAINRVLQKNGLQKLDLSKFAGIENPRELVNMLQSQLNTLLKRGAKPAEIKEFQTKINTLKVDADKYDLTRITKGLNNELGKLKDEYELAVELDANPELGGIFADYMGIDLKELPKNAEEAAKKAQQYIDKILRENGSKEKIDIASLMGKDAFNKWIKSSGHSVEDDIVKVVDNYRQALHKMQVDESKKQMQEWDKLLEKYAEYEYKVTQIQKEAERERETARKKGASQEIFDAINNREKQELARVSFEEFQKSPEWIVATGDLANMSKSAIGMLIEQLEKYKRSAKNLSPKQIKQLNSALSKLYKEQRKNNPFKAISNMLDEAKERMSTFDEDIKKTQEEIDKLTKKKKESIVEGVADEETDNKLKKAIERLKELKKAREETGEVDASSWVSSINETISAVQSAIGVFDDLAKAIGGVENSDLDKAFSVIDKAGQGAAIGAQIGQGYGAIIGAVVGAATGLISIFAGAANERITAKVEESERAVKRLELAYIDLEHAVQQAYGMATIGANMAAKANKELQLVELKRQLALERSRDSKHRDEDKIIDLQKQIKELEYDIADTVDNIVNDLLGISSIGDAMESMMDAFVEALRSGEDAMAKFDESVDEMIANMVKKMFTTKILQPWFEEQWNKIQEKINQRAGDIPDKLAEIQSKTSIAKNADTTNNDSLVEALRALGMSNDQIDRLNWYNEFGQYDWGLGSNARLKAAYEKMLKEAEQKEIEIQKELTTATMPTTDDIRQYAELLRSGQPVMEENMQEVANFLRELGLMKDDASKNLSNLQAGISGITEDTAGALESYMNGVSQQVYLHSDLLTQIRDAVVGIDIDIQVATQAQMLLQLQQSYAVQMAIQGILEGWNNPSGQAVRVELVS